MKVPEARSGQLGFGTAHLYGGRQRQHSIALVRAALDAGIGWIDTAPLYGHGAAEGIVGEAIRGRRDGLTLSTKAGIEPPNITLRYRLQAKAAALSAKLAGGRAVLRAPPPPRPQFNMFSPADIVRGVERSLKALGTDRLDVLLLHEVDASTAFDPELLATLRRLVAQGKVIAFGTATQTGETLRIAANPHVAEFALLQMPEAAQTSSIVLPGNTGIVLHSLLGCRLTTILKQLRSDDRARSAARGFGIDPDEPDLPRRLVAAAAMRPKVRAALFSTSNLKRLRDIASSRALTPDEAAAGTKLLHWALDDARMPLPP